MFVRIGPMIYTVSIVEAIPDDKTGDSFAGEIDFNEGHILVKDRRDQVSMLVTLWHEILHALLRQSGNGDIRRVESVCDALSYGLVDIFGRVSSAEIRSALFDLIDRPVEEVRI